MNTPLTGERANEQAADKSYKSGQQSSLIQMLSYDLGFEVASPVEQIAELIPWNPEHAILGLSCERAGLVINRGRSIPLYCLSNLLGIPLKPATPTASILVVEGPNGVVGFAVPGLITIESGAYDKTHATTADQMGRPGFGHVMLGSEMQHRMIGTLDLKDMASFVQSEQFEKLQTALAQAPVTLPSV